MKDQRAIQSAVPLTNRNDSPAIPSLVQASCCFATRTVANADCPCYPLLLRRLVLLSKVEPDSASGGTVRLVRQCEAGRYSQSFESHISYWFDRLDRDTLKVRRLALVECPFVSVGGKVCSRFSSD